ncbi:ABC transporter permease [uncultured Nevskia sp.]|uniref:ABC transporter permease n=1 Tax=uncultured Nevskia sp. TaxID=228950 RepID=UPI0025F1BA80|nr:ABC transporter permease [uncultured Nevskia sp.]
MPIVLTIARTEARRIFVSPLAWTVLAVLQSILGVVFLLLILDYAQNPRGPESSVGLSDYIGGGLYSFATLVLLLVMPLLTMRLFAEERQNGNLTLLLASPVSLIEIVLGKFLGLFSFIAATILLLAAMPLMLLVGSNLDLGRIAAGLLGLSLMMMALGAAGLYVSSLTREPTIAAVASFGLLLMLWLMQVLSSQPGWIGKLLGYLAIVGHFENLRRGIFSSVDIVYYLLFTVLFLWLAVLQLDSERN